MSESQLVKKLMLAGPYIGMTLLRNNVGRIQAKSGAWVQFGLCVGSSDLIGWQSRYITPEDIGKKVAVFTAVEAKSPTGKLTQEQENFLMRVQEAGGIAIEARSIEDLLGMDIK